MSLMRELACQLMISLPGPGGPTASSRILQQCITNENLHLTDDDDDKVDDNDDDDDNINITTTTTSHNNNPTISCTMWEHRNAIRHSPDHAQQETTKQALLEEVEAQLDLGGNTLLPNDQYLIHHQPLNIFRGRTIQHI